MRDRSDDPDLFRAARRSGATGVFLSGYLPDGGAPVLKALRACLGARTRILAPDGFDNVLLTAEAGSSAEGMTVSVPGVPISALPAAGRRFISQFNTSLIAPAQTYSVYAAQAAQLMLNAIARSNGTRGSVTRKLLTANIHDGILGNFAINQHGDTTADTVAIYQVRNGTLVPLSVITPPAAVLEP
jgi:branched-chain amino acid transport system substrate-binding protein